MFGFSQLDGGGSDEPGGNLPIEAKVWSFFFSDQDTDYAQRFLADFMAGSGSLDRETAGGNSKFREQRGYPRVTGPIPGWYRPPWTTDYRRCSALDISPGGSLLGLEAGVEVGVSFELSLEMDEDWTLDTEVEVLRSEPAFQGYRHAVAVRFNLLAPGDRNWLPVWCRRAAKREEMDTVRRARNLLTD